MAKAIAQQSNATSIFWLKKHGYLDGGWRYGGIKWAYGMSGNESSIGFTVNTNGNEGDNIRLQYTQTNRWTGGKNEINFKISLTTTPCNYGGVRYWFICPLSKNGQYCGRRVGVIYRIGKYFGCRYCGEIAYLTQMESGKFRWNGVSVPDLERAEKDVKRYYYNGKPTRKYRRVIRLNEKLRSFLMMGMRFNKR